MSSPLVWKVHNGTEQIGSTRYAEDAAALVSLAGEGARVLADGCIVWREGREAQPAGESYDYAADVMHQRRRAAAERALARRSPR